MIGHLLLALPGMALFYAGLGFLIFGNGFFKPNISTMVGGLYPAGDGRRDSAFTIFYMGINLGAILGNFICGTLGERVGWHWGFGAAALGMTAGVIQFALGAYRLGGAGLQREKPQNVPARWAMVCAGLLLMAAGLYYFFAYRLVLVAIVTAAFFAWLVSQTKDGVERKRVLAIMILFVFATLFWAGEEQSGGSLNLFADRLTRNSIFGWNYPSSWLQAVNAGFIWMLAPVFAWLWLRMGKREPSSPAKFAWALLFVGLGFLVLAVASRLSPPIAAGIPVTATTKLPADALVSPLWLIVLYLLHTIGELCLSPVGLSAVTKLAPERLVGSMMGVWFLSIALGNMLGGQVAVYFETFPLVKLFGIVFLTTAVAGLVLTTLVPYIRRLMSGVH
jgi:proton-dependent oligopeptide transporter, POT family